MCLFVVSAYIPWYFNLFYDLSREPLIIKNVPSWNFEKIIFDILRISFFDFHFLWNPILTVLCLPFLIRGLIRLKKNFPNSPPYLLQSLIFIFVLPFIFFYLFIATNRIRYFAPFTFPFLILLAYGLQNLNLQGIKRKSIFILAAVFFLVNNFMDFVDFFTLNLNEQWKQAAQLIKQIPDYHNKNYVFIFQTRYNPPVFSYYFWGPKAAALLVDNITTKDEYDGDLSALGIKDKLYVIEKMKGKKFFDILASSENSAWIWIFRYHDRVFADDFRMENENRYFFHQILLSRELPQIDMYLLKKIKK
jgi:hypothetical protein